MTASTNVVLVASLFASIGLMIAYGDAAAPTQKPATFSERFPRPEEMMYPAVWVSTGEKTGYYTRAPRRSVRPWRNRAACAALPAASERAQCLRRYCRWRAARGVGCDGSPSATRGSAVAG